MKLVSSEKAVSHIQSKHHIYIHTAAAAPQQLVRALTDRHNELKGVQIFHLHTEMFSDGMIPLIESGVVTNSEKKVHPGKVVDSFAMGTRQLYDFMDDNPLIQMM